MREPVHFPVTVVSLSYNNIACAYKMRHVYRSGNLSMRSRL